MPGPATWSWPTTVRFGAGRVGELAEACRAAGILKPLLVTDPGLAALPMTARVLAALRAEGVPVAVFSAVKANPTGENVAEGVAAFRAGGHDGVIAFGGGSALDCGKAVAFMTGQKRPIWDFEDIGDWWTRADPAGIAPVVAVPTTAGTGSEVGRAGVITNSVEGVKKIIFHPAMLPAQVILDPELTRDLPPQLTAWTGMDALSHCVEAYCAPSFHPMAEGIAVEGIRLVRENLLRAYRDGSDMEARGQMLAAAAMGAVSFQKGLGAIHALSHPIGALYDTHHGLTNAVLLPYVLDFNREAVYDKIDRLAAWLGLEGGFAGFLDFLLRLRRDLGVPHTLDRIGVKADQIARMARMAVADPTAAGNPRALTVWDARDLYDRAIEGRVA
ncbi:MAG: alcohol dehydrogenase [Rhodovulum sulfidophilum]|uniref:Alcohol dehydrogenase 2 n=1 Tax=Rhodovulum sulfidophilum TaxID=35806 RepID=A0A2W5NFW3_RHOSU|nr:MAG: alcohol dehydrogenase [Rhodovulum sulfidophilum]